MTDLCQAFWLMFVIKTEAHFFIDFVSGCSNDEENDGHGVNM